MDWFKKLSSVRFSKERISDLNHVIELLYKDQRQAISILLTIQKSFEEQKNDAYIPQVQEIIKTLKDSPLKAHELIKILIHELGA